MSNRKAFTLGALVGAAVLLTMNYIANGEVYRELRRYQRREAHTKRAAEQHARRQGVDRFNRVINDHWWQNGDNRDD